MKELSNGTYRAELIIDSRKNIVLPFVLVVQKNDSLSQLTILNGEEKITVDEIVVKNKTYIIQLPVFDSEIIAKVDSDGVFRGTWINHARKDMNVIAFEAEAQKEYRFFPVEDNYKGFDFSGKWEVAFSQGAEDEYKALGVFSQKGNRAYGTFLTETGDYRYLEGNVKNDSLYLSCFDGSHAFLFKAVKQADGSLQGEFWSGIHHYEKWIAKRNDTFELAKPDTLIKSITTNEIDFSFPNLDSVITTLSDEKYKNKAVVVQLMGSWCPNCMDETAYLSELYKKLDKSKIEIIALCFERTTEFSVAKRNIERLKNKYNSSYQFLVAGTASKKEAAEKLPWLSHVASFPTTILLNKKHEVVKIYSGFNGPATGKYFAEFKIEFEREVELL
ncbi:MAG: TlpA family protein disulfide reductase [Bacteroidetes bacterium]|nr:TlpA family protein disulfide reductase [Bacteroidota bacterium]